MDDKNKHIENIKNLKVGEEYVINWIEESGALIEKVIGGYNLQDVTYGNINDERFYSDKDLFELVTQGMSYT